MAHVVMLTVVAVLSVAAALMVAAVVDDVRADRRKGDR